MKKGEKIGLGLLGLAALIASGGTAAPAVLGEAGSVAAGAGEAATAAEAAAAADAAAAAEAGISAGDAAGALEAAGYGAEGASTGVGAASPGAGYLGGGAGTGASTGELGTGAGSLGSTATYSPKELLQLEGQKGGIDFSKLLASSGEKAKDAAIAAGFSTGIQQALPKPQTTMFGQSPFSPLQLTQPHGMNMASYQQQLRNLGFS